MFPIQYSYRCLFLLYNAFVCHAINKKQTTYLLAYFYGVLDALRLCAIQIHDWHRHWQYVPNDVDALMSLVAAVRNASISTSQLDGVQEARYSREIPPQEALPRAATATARWWRIRHYLGKSQKSPPPPEVGGVMFWPEFFCLFVCLYEWLEFAGLKNDGQPQKRLVVGPSP